MKQRTLIKLTAIILAVTLTSCQNSLSASLSNEPAETSAVTAATTTAASTETEPVTTTAKTTAEPVSTTKPATTTKSSTGNIQTNEYGFADDDLSDLCGGKPASTTKPATTTKSSTSKNKYGFADDDDLSDLFGGNPASTTKPATTTTKPTQETEPVETKTIPVMSFETTDFVQYTYADNKLKINSRCPTLYDFADTKSVGVGMDGRSFRFTEMSYGASARITRNTLTYKTYSNSAKTFTVKSTILEDDNSSTTLTTAGSKDTGYDISKLPNGLYRLRISLSTGDIFSLYFLINGTEAYLCSAEGLTSSQIKSYRERREKIYQLIKAEDISANDCLDTSQLCYPYYPYNENYRCDTQRWIDMSNQICKSSWTAEHKLYALYEWMTANLAYDYYKKDVLGMTRARYFSDWSGTHATYTTHVGVCGLY